MHKLIIYFVYLYRSTIGLLLPPSCRYTPTCSQYMIDAVTKHGALKGVKMGISRIARCHPWSEHNSWDPVK